MTPQRSTSSDVALFSYHTAKRTRPPTSFIAENVNGDDHVSMYFQRYESVQSVDDYNVQYNDQPRQKRPTITANL